MKTVQRSSKASSSHIFEEYKSIDSSSVPVTTLKLSARIRNQQRRQVGKLSETSEVKIGINSNAISII